MLGLLVIRFFKSVAHNTLLAINLERPGYLTFAVIHAPAAVFPSCCVLWLLLRGHTLRLVVILIVRHQHVLLNVGQVQVLQEFIKVDLLLFNLNEKLLSMRPCLGASPSAYVLLNFAPLLAKVLQSFQEPYMLLFGPTSLS